MSRHLQIELLCDFFIYFYWHLSFEFCQRYLIIIKYRLFWVNSYFDSLLKRRQICRFGNNIKKSRRKTFEKQY